MSNDKNHRLAVLIDADNAQPEGVGGQVRIHQGVPEPASTLLPGQAQVFRRLCLR